MLYSGVCGYAAEGRRDFAILPLALLSIHY